MFGKKGSFGRKAGALQPPTDSDGRTRVFGEAIFASPQGDFLRSLGFSLDDPSNVIDDELGFRRKLKQSEDELKLRQTELEKTLLSEHRHNAIKPFFLCGEAIFNGDLGPWMMRSLKILPYQEWNVAYLPMDKDTQRAMGENLPLHPQSEIPPLDKLLHGILADYKKEYDEKKSFADAEVGRIGLVAAKDIAIAFGNYALEIGNKIPDHVSHLKPNILASLAEFQRTSLGL